MMVERKENPTHRKAAKTVCLVLLILGLLNFALFMIGTAYLGGDAGNGKIDAGHYFLADHGRLTEVSKSVFQYSKLHAASLFFTHPVAIISGILYRFL
jgi:hypothetical protein